MKLKILLLLSLSIILLSSCVTREYLHNKKFAYLKSENGKKIQVPKGLSDKKLSTYYIIPPPVAGNPGVSMVPPGSRLDKKKS